MKATEVLRRQHREVLGLFKKAESSDDTGERRDLCAQIKEQLQAHSRLEERLFYPAVDEQGPKKAHELVLEALEEHHVVDLVLRELPDLDPADERFEAKLTVLKELVRHHVEEEEHEMFKLAEKLGRSQLERLGQQLREEANGSGARARLA